MTNSSDTILLVGCGKMGHALLRGWLARGIAADRIVAIEPGDAAREAAALAGVRAVGDLDELEADVGPRMIVFAVEPQAMDAVVPPYARFARPGTCFLSIAAGKPLRYFAAGLGEDAAVIRAMPNTPAAIGRGISVLCASGATTDDDRMLAEKLLAAAGSIAWIDDEGLMDAVTAVSGSGPAYVFYLIECLAEAGVTAGLPVDLAARLARETVEGAAALSHEEAADPATLRKNVASPGGTTEAALNVLMAKDGLQRVMTDAVAAATRRSIELAE